MWPFRSTASRSALAELKRELEVLRADHELLAAQHKTLRGYTYGKLGRIHADEPKNAAPVDQKAALRKQLGILPGRPFNHGA